MIKFNFFILLISSFIPLVVGAIYYRPELAGKFLNLEANTSKNKHKSIVYVFTFILSFAYSIALSYQVIHQLHFQSMFYNEVGFLTKEGVAFKDFEYIMATYSQSFRTFKHGMFHGFLNSIFIVMPIMGIHFLFEGKTWKYIFTHWFYWAICGILMGGIICEFY